MRWRLGKILTPNPMTCSPFPPTLRVMPVAHEEPLHCQGTSRLKQAAGSPSASEMLFAWEENRTDSQLTNNKFF